MDALSNHCFRGLYAVSSRRRRPFSYSYYSKVFHSCGDSISVEKKHTQWIPPSASSSPAGEGIVESRIQYSCESSQLRSLSKTVHVRVVLKKACLFGQQFLLVGGDAILGLWDPADAILMDWSEGDVWTAELDLPIGKLFEFKLILRGLSGEIYWQLGPDRVLQVWETTKTIVVTEDWENAENQKVVEEESLAIPTEEVISTESKISTDTESLANETQIIKPSETKIITDTGSLANETQIIKPSETKIITDTGSLANETQIIWPSETKIITDTGSLANETQIIRPSETMTGEGLSQGMGGDLLLVPDLTSLPAVVAAEDCNLLQLSGEQEDEDLLEVEETITLSGKVEDDSSSEETITLSGKAEDDGSSEETMTLWGKVEDDGSSEETITLCGKAEDDSSSEETMTLCGKAEDDDSSELTPSSDDGDSPEGFDSQAAGGGGVIRNSNLWGINTLHQLLLNLGFKINPPHI